MTAVPTDRPSPRAKAERLFPRLPARGCWVSLPTPIAAEIVGDAGVDFVILDLEHGTATYETVVAQLIALRATGTAAVARVPELYGPWIKRTLDAGAQALIVPMVATADAAADAVRAFRYGPDGVRGNATRMVRAARYGADPDYLTRWRDEGVLMVQIESPEALNNAEAIAAVDGVDALFFGPSDYGAAAGFPGDAALTRALDQVTAAARASGKLVATVLFADHDADALEARGVDILGVASDVSLLRKGAAGVAQR